MADDNRPDSIIVIGAGIVGASIAFHLANKGAKVTILATDEPGHSASAVSFAWINAREKNPRDYHDLNRRSLDMWDRFARRLGGDIGLKWGGELRWVGTPDGAQAMNNRVRTLQSWGYPIHLLSIQDLRQLEPGINPGALTSASLSPADGHVDTHKVISACLAGASQRGAVVLSRTKATGLELAQSANRSKIIEAVRSGEDQLPCGAVVLAGGPDSQELANQFGIDLPVQHTFGATLITEPIPPILQRVAVIHSPPDREPQIALRQFENGSVMIHGGEGGATGESLGRTESEIEQVMAEATKYVPALKGVKIAEIRKGRRPVPRDGHPILGFTKEITNLYVAVTHSGVTLAALIGEFAALEILNGIRIALLEPYRLERFTSYK